MREASISLCGPKPSLPAWQTWDDFVDTNENVVLSKCTSDEAIVREMRPAVQTSQRPMTRVTMKTTAAMGLLFLLQYRRRRRWAT